MEQTIVSAINEEKSILRECRGRSLAISRRVFGTLYNSKIHFYVGSEYSIYSYYFVEYKNEYNFCTCWDFASNRSDKCKHLYAVEHALRLNLVKKIDKRLPIAQKPTVMKPQSWEDDSYDF